VAVYVELAAGGPEDDLDDALADDVGRVLDLAEDHLRAGGFTVAQATGNGVLGVRLLTGDEAAARAEAEAAARALSAAIAARPGADARVRARVAAHTGEVLVRPGPEPEIAGGSLLSTSAWPRA
jgi:serine/threonine-protein kinase